MVGLLFRLMPYSASNLPFVYEFATRTSKLSIAVCPAAPSYVSWQKQPTCSASLPFRKMLACCRMTSLFSGKSLALIVPGVFGFAVWVTENCSIPAIGICGGGSLKSNETSGRLTSSSTALVNW